MMSDAPSPMVVSISISKSPDLSALGLSNGHLNDAMYEIATHLLANGADLAYGGNLEPDGFTEMLFELLYRYRNGAGADGAHITNYLPWPVHISMDIDKIMGVKSGLGQIRLRLIGRGGEDISVEERRNMPSRQPSEHEWSEGLTSMRKVMCAETDARVALGGRVERYKGIMPGIAEEVLLSLESRRPVFLFGGFGGCAGAIAETMGLAGSRRERSVESKATWARLQPFKRYGSDDLCNGLTHEENHILAESPYIGQTVTLMLKGIHRLRRGKPGDDRYKGE